jgi:rubrerythrin
MACGRDEHVRIIHYIYRESAMNIYEYAMQMEKDGEKFYLLLAGNCQVEGLATIFGSSVLSVLVPKNE